MLFIEQLRSSVRVLLGTANRELPCLGVGMAVFEEFVRFVVCIDSAIGTVVGVGSEWYFNFNPPHFIISYGCNFLEGCNRTFAVEMSWLLCI
ncbi:uncharacterized protein J3R85_009843 [Psidium guajava]|nr:uncharacterized protein J3R85_009843 [Psidium guajava]